MSQRNIQRGFTISSDWAPYMSHIHVVLVHTTHAGNIGAVARVMKNMGLSNLTLVSSTECGPETEAFATASGAYDIVMKARRVETLRAALEGMVMVVGASARLGKKRVTARTPEELVPMFMEKARLGEVACVFGRESRGLTNEEMKLCTDHLIIPTDQSFASLNLAHAAAIFAYEVFKVACRPFGYQLRHFRPASVESREQMYEHIESVLLAAGFLDASDPLRMMREIRRIFNSARLDERDVAIVRGMFRKMGNLFKRLSERALPLTQDGR
ncbi:MAG: RNA methyltransferase [Desulfomonilaceae bacterium]